MKILVKLFLITAILVFSTAYAVPKGHYTCPSSGLVAKAIGPAQANNFGKFTSWLIGPVSFDRITFGGYGVLKGVADASLKLYPQSLTNTALQKWKGGGGVGMVCSYNGQASNGIPVSITLASIWGQYDFSNCTLDGNTVKCN